MTLRNLARGIACSGALLLSCSSDGSSVEPTAGAAGFDQQSGASGSPASGASGAYAGVGGTPMAGASGGSLASSGAGLGGGNGQGAAPPAAGSSAAGQVGASGASGSTGSGGAGGPSCPPGVAFCDDFESYPVAAPPAGKWQPEGKASDGFAMTVDAIHAYSGSKAFHVAVNYTGDSYAEIYMGAKSGVSGNTGYARFMMYQTSWERPHPDVPPGIHARLFVIGNVAVDLDFSPTVFTLELDHDGFGPTAHMGPTPILNKWICIKAQLGPTLALTVDDKVISVPAGGGKGLDAFKLGISTYRKFSTDFWIDDLVVDTKPLDCPKP